MKNTNRIFKTWLGILFLLPFLMGTSCKKECDEPTPFYPLDEDFLSYFAFPVGSWWVYEEVNTGERDSCYVILNETEVDEMFLGRKDGCGFSYKYEQLYLSEVIHNDTVNGSAMAHAPIQKLDYYFFSHQKGAFFKIINLELGRDTFNRELFIRDRYETLKVRGILYENVIVIGQSVSSQNEFPQNIYYSKNVGVIRRDYTEGTQWELVKYHINH